MDFKAEDDSETYSDSNSEFNSFTKSKRPRKSYVWTFFRPIQVNGKQVNECIICNACVGKQTSNLARHLITTHSITKPTQKGSPDDKTARLRPSRSFVWKYSTKEDLNHARCHFCNKVLYCGGGNTSNLSKHLRRRHMDLIDERNDSMTDRVEEVAQATSAIIEQEYLEEDGTEEGVEVEGGEENGLFRVYTVETSTSDIKNISDSNSAKDRRGSYVWNFCDKLSKHTIRCKLCSKVMSFHGTANVITHLQRRHNIVGPICKDPSSYIEKDYRETTSDAVDESDNNLLVRRRSMGTASVVWKYCKRISRDTVRCSFCKKNLSYQGTSNLQRHLHRMHGIVTQGRNYKSPVTPSNVKEEEFHFDAEFLWEYLDEFENGQKAKCKMCDAVLDAKDMGAITRHLVNTHALRPPDSNPKRPKRFKTNVKFEFSDDSGDDNGNWSSNFGDGETVEEITELNIKKDDSFFNEFIEEDHEAGTTYDEPIDPNVTQVTISNPLSPQSTQSCAGDMSPDRRNNKHSSCLYRNNPKLQKLNEERLRMETEYFKEKAAFFRMQKYYIGLQAKKIRIEMERISSAPIEYAGPTYTVNVDIPQEELAILPTQ